MDDPNYGSDGRNYDLYNPNYEVDGPTDGFPPFFVCASFCVSIVRLLDGLRRLASAKPKSETNVCGRLAMINCSLHFDCMDDPNYCSDGLKYDLDSPNYKSGRP